MTAQFAKSDASDDMVFRRCQIVKIDGPLIVS